MVRLRHRVSGVVVTTSEENAERLAGDFERVDESPAKPTPTRRASKTSK